MPKNENCSISDSALCKWISRDCQKCFISSLKKEEQAKKALEDFEVTLSMLPDDFDDLQDPDCLFCKGEKGKRFGYILADMAHMEPKSETGMFFGFGKKVRRRVGSYVITSISVCRSCRTSMFIKELLKWILPIAAFGIAASVLSVPAIAASLDQLITLCILALSILAGYITGVLISKAFMSVKKKKTRFDVFEIPICAKMRDLGWFTMQDGSKFIFSKKSQTRRVNELKKDFCEAEAAVQTSFFND